MDLIVQNLKISAPIEAILKLLKSELRNGKLRDIEEEVQDNIKVTCPIHKNGFERNPSCSVYTRRNNDKVEYGKVHCFTCGYTASLPQFICDCFGVKDLGFGEQWLIDKFGGDYYEDNRYLSDIVLKKVSPNRFLDESILDEYNFYHDYMWDRKLKKEVVDTFRVGYDSKRKMLVFPVWDEYGKLVMLTRRSVVNKTFLIDENVDKPVYLLNFINKFGYKHIYVCESQINALTLWGWGYPAVALFGTGSAHQYEILNRCGVRCYTLCFDGDEAGYKGTYRFVKNIRKDVLVSAKKLPVGKDINDLTKEEFEKLQFIL